MAVVAPADKVEEITITINCEPAKAGFFMSFSKMTYFFLQVK